MTPTRGRGFAALAFALSALCALPVTGCGDSTSRRIELPLGRNQATINAYLGDIENALQPHLEAIALELATHPEMDRLFLNPEAVPPTSEANFNRLAEFYANRQYEPLFLVDNTLSADGIFLSQSFIGADRHGLNPEDFHASAIRAALARAEDSKTPVITTPEITLTEEERETLRAWVKNLNETQDELPPLANTLDVLTRDETTSPLPRIAKLAHAIDVQPSDATLALLDLDFLLADSWLRFGIAQRFGNMRYVDTPTANARHWLITVDGAPYSTRQPGSVRPDPEVDTSSFTTISSEDVALTFAVESLEQAAAQDGGFAAAFESLYPPFEQYRLLVQAEGVYREFVRQGGWGAPLPKEAAGLSVGAAGPSAAALRNRLAKEGYIAASTSDVFDEPLRQALIEYQKTHQFAANGVLTDETITSLNVPAETRLAQILVTMGHWRTTAIGEDFDDEYILVNVPDFHAELWDKGELITRFATVVGRPRNLSGGRTIGRTVLFSDELNYVVFNPYWNVPQSIWNNEYASKIAEDPTWLETHNFEIITTNTGGQLLRQRPGPSNALGLVKFLFPNEHDIYLHDTPQRHLFAHAHRAYSHGCIRVQDALGFARLLLQRDRNMSESAARSEVNRRLATAGEQWVTLNRFIPIHIEYYVVRVNEDGRTEFLSDLHRSDRPLVEAKEAEIRAWLSTIQPSQIAVESHAAETAPRTVPEPALFPEGP